MQSIHQLSQNLNLPAESNPPLCNRIIATIRTVVGRVFCCCVRPNNLDGMQNELVNNAPEIQLDGVVVRRRERGTAGTFNQFANMDLGVLQERLERINLN